MQKAKIKRIAVLAMILFISTTLTPNIRQVHALDPYDPSSSDATPKWGGTFIIGIDSDPTPLNPALTTSTAKGIVYGNIWNTLIQDDLNYETGQWFQVPELAESWTESADHLTFTFNLVKNATWHDGVNFTSADVQFSFMNVIKAPGGHPSGSTLWAKITSVDTPDNYTAVFRLSATDPDFLWNIASMAYAGIVPKHIYTHVNGTVFSIPEIRAVASDPDYMIGTGPFMYKEWVHGDHLTLVRNPNYFKAPLPYLDSVIYKIVPDATTRILSLETGDIDEFNHDVSTADAASLNGSVIGVTGKGSEYAPSGSMMHINLRNPILSNRLVRWAIQAGTNRDQMSELATNGLYKPANGFIASDWKVWDNPEVQALPYNTTYANELLDQAGYPRQTDGTRFTLRFQWVPSDNVEDNKCVEIFRDNMAQIGISINLLPMDDATYEQTTDDNWDFDLALWQGYGQPSEWYRMYYSGNIVPGKGNNEIGYNNTEVDHLLDTFTTSLNLTERQQAIRTAEAIVNYDKPDMGWLVHEHFTAWRQTFVNGAIMGHWANRDGADNVWWSLATKTSPTGETSTETAAGFPWLEVGAVAVVVAVIAGLGVTTYFVRRRKK